MKATVDNDGLALCTPTSQPWRRHGNGTRQRTMPLFGSLFPRKKVSRRKLAVPQVPHGTGEDESSSPKGEIALTLGDVKTVFDNGEWIPKFEPLSQTKRENLNLKEVISQLEEENNLLKLKYEILLDMLAQESLSRPE